MTRVSRINRRIVQKISLHAQPSIQLVAQTTGWQIVNHARLPTFASVGLRVAPQAVITQRGERVQIVRLLNPTDQMLRLFLILALLIPVFCRLAVSVAHRQNKELNKEEKNP